MNDSDRFLYKWVLDDSVDGGVYEGQDGPWCIASNEKVENLLAASSLSQAIPARRDLILFAIAIDLQHLLSADDVQWKDQNVMSCRKILIRYARDNWHEFLRIDKRFGLGDEFHELVAPLVIDCHKGETEQ